MTSRDKPVPDYVHDATSGSKRVVLEVRDLWKEYPGTVALRGFDFVLRAGEVRALLGKNGAGKSTFVEILSGTIPPTSGAVFVDGSRVGLESPAAAAEEGIATVHQDLRLFLELTVRENLTLGRCSRFGVISRRDQAREAAEALARLEVSVDLEEKVGRLSPRDQQLVAVAKALLHEPKVLILDEPTSALHPDEISHLIALVRRLAEWQEVGVIYVSHRLDEVPRVADSVTVIRDGQLVATCPTPEMDRDQIIEMMLGHALAVQRRSFGRARSTTRFCVHELAAPPRLTKVDFHVQQGEIVGMWGMPGAGRTELLRCIYGLDAIESGWIEIDDTVVPNPSPRQLISLGVGFCPDDRRREGLVLPLSVSVNLVLASPGSIARGGVISRSRERMSAVRAADTLSIKTSGLSVSVETLSGGNQQKVVIGRWLTAGTRLLLLDEPTKGVDVETKEALYVVLEQLAADGVSVVWAPTEPEELFTVCDRILVVKDGRIADELDPATATPADVMNAALADLSSESGRV